MNILPLCCFPSAVWLNLANHSAIVDVGENYVKQSFRNRFDIAGVNGKITLTIPVEGQNGNKVPFREIKIARGTWQKQHLRSVRAAYGRSPYFEHFYPELEPLFLNPPELLETFNLEVLKWISLCGYKPLHQYSSSYIDAGSYDRDFRNKFEPTSQWPGLPEYLQVFSDRHPYMDHLSSIDLMMNLGPALDDYLRSFEI